MIIIKKLTKKGIKQKKCGEKGHDWEHEGGFDFEIDEVSFPQKCAKCGLKGREVFVYSCVVDDDGNKIE